MFSLADAIIDEDLVAINALLQHGVDINQIDEYGFTPLIEAAIADNIEIAKLLLAQGADPNDQDATGNSALHWAAENNNIAMCRLLLKANANPNAYNFAGQPVLVMPLLRKQTKLRRFLIQHGADLIFAQDYINTKLLGHMFELVGTAEIISPANQFVEVDFEGFFLEVTLGIIADSLTQFQNHYAARQLRRYAGLAQFIVEILDRSAILMKYQQYRVDKNQHRAEIERILAQEPLLIPVGYEGHAITFIKYGHFWVKCDRREDSRLYDNIMFYTIGRPAEANQQLFKTMLYQRLDDDFVNHQLDHLLELQPLTELKIAAQISGNCSWANVEAVVPAIFFLILMQMDAKPESLNHYKELALNFYKRWREWNKDRALDFCIQSYESGDTIRQACKAEVLAAILFQRCDPRNAADHERIERILSILIKSPYEYILRNYLRVYYYESYTEEGKRFAELLRQHDFLKK